MEDNDDAEPSPREMVDSSFAERLHAKLKQYPQRFPVLLRVWCNDTADICQQLAERIPEFSPKVENVLNFRFMGVSKRD